MRLRVPSKSARHAAILSAGILCGGVSASLSAQTPPVPTIQPGLHHVSPAEYRAHLDSLHALILACRQDSAVCDPAKVGSDDRVDDPAGAFQVRFEWLRDVLTDVPAPADKAYPDRAAKLDQAAARIADDLSPAAPAAQPALAPARTAANNILSRNEFRTVARQSWLDRKIAAFWQAFNRIFDGASSLGHRAPWLAQALEWGFVGLTIVGVLVWFQRTMQRQRLEIALGGSGFTGDWQKESTDWAELARTQASQGDWREAVHCLYWASIVALEGRRLWRRNYARTPREYLVLLEPGSPQQTALGLLTRIFERIWYGLRPAAQQDYAEALALYESLRESPRHA